MTADAVVRAYDLGGFGDIAGAMRVASFLQKTGIKTRIKAKSKSALKKLQILKPDVEFTIGDNGSNKGMIQVDVAGHYRDDRNLFNGDVPHHFTEDMDNPISRRRFVPIYMKTGLLEWEPEIPVQFSIQGGNPMFYRPFREWDLPKPEERDVRRQIIEAIRRRREIEGLINPSGKIKRLFGFGKKDSLEHVLDQTDKIGFAHLSPQIQEFSSETILEHPYFYAVHTAHIRGASLGVGLFLPSLLEGKLSRAALQNHWNVVSSNGDVIKFNADLPTLFFLGQQPQMTTTGLFLASNIPNLVTGDLSLSDALYGLIAMEGQGFFYETPDWKMPTHMELARILDKFERTLSGTYFAGSNHHSRFKFKNEEGAMKQIQRGLELAVQIFGNPKMTKAYAENMREAVLTEIKRRFGDVPVEAQGKGGFYISPGAPYLLQDATARVIETLREDPDTFSEVEGIRKMLQNGVPVTVNVQTGVLESAPQQLIPEAPIFYDPFFEYTLLKKYGKKENKENFYKKNMINIIKKDYKENIFLKNKDIDNYINKFEINHNKKYEYIL